MQTVRIPAVCPRPRLQPIRRVRPVKASINWQDGISITGQYLGLFVLFTSSMNWWYYRRTREDIEKNQKK